ncbi:hypothetical protein GY45DRAFT_985564 [Cubamyces sp. BRFM 1775]|nr:hypothetical protein GY45DRAFT_985564 [Cubamyces sp. BRFM 1775]
MSEVVAVVCSMMKLYHHMGAKRTRLGSHGRRSTVPQPGPALLVATTIHSLFAAPYTHPNLPTAPNHLILDTMSHGDHGGHDMPGMPTGPKCSMNMLWNTQIEDTCIVFRSWHISSHTAFVLSCAAVVGLGVLYEWLRAAQRTLDRRIAATLRAQGKGKAAAGIGAGVEVSDRSTPECESEEAGLLTGSLVPKARVG